MTRCLPLLGAPRASQVPRASQMPQVLQVPQVSQVSQVSGPAALSTRGGAAAAALLCLSSCAAGPYEVPLPATTALRVTAPFTRDPLRLEVSGHHGHVLVRPARTLRCTAQVRLYAPSTAELEARLQAVRLEFVEADDGSRTRIAIAHAAGLDAVDVSWVLDVPARVALRIDTPAAEVAVRGYAGDLQLHGGIGAARLDLGGGEADVQTTSAPVRLRGTAPRVSVRTQSGTIEALLPPAPHDCEWRLATDSARIAVDVPFGRALHVSCEAPRGAVRADTGIAWSKWALPRASGPRAPDAAPDQIVLHEGMVGAAGEPYRGSLHIAARTGAVDVRLLPAAAGAR